MSQQPKTETDRLANVIQVLQLGQKTGRLIVERDDGLHFEQGIITFVNGQVVQASVNQQQGPDALNWLRSWGACRFTFSPEPRSGVANRTPSLTPRPTWERPGSRPLGTPTQSTPATGPMPAARPAYPPQPHSYNLRGKTTKDLGGPGSGQLTPGAWLTTPYRTRHIEEGMHLIEHMGLSRTHRRLFLLIDGGRTVKELIRLMAHEPEDVQRLLRDLERAGVIQQ